MIFVTIGSMFPFDRLIKLMDDLAPRWPDEAFLAQIGRGEYEPRNMKFVRSLPATQFAETLAECRLIVAHAGMGSVISALEAGRPIVILPRDAQLREHTTDHQMATAKWLVGRGGVYSALTDRELPGMVDRALSATGADEKVSTAAPADFLAKIRAFTERS